MESEFGTAAARSDPGVDLPSRIQAGDSGAEEEFVNAYGRGVMVVATVRTRDREAARDLTQEILIAVLTALRDGQLREASKLSAFVQGTARNLINNYLRSRTRRPECDLESVVEPSADPVEKLESAERHRLIRRELESFGPTDQQILLLSVVDGHSLLDVAQRLELSHDVVRARRSRMIRKITKKFSSLSQK
jgi:RNA polymerase sigma factor (sigma-70 family)